MRLEAFALIKAGASGRDALIAMLAKLDGVTSVESIRGPYNIVARVLFDGGAVQPSAIEQLAGLGQVELCWLSSQRGPRSGE